MLIFIEHKIFKCFFLWIDLKAAIRYDKYHRVELPFVVPLWSSFFREFPDRCFPFDPTLPTILPRCFLYPGPVLFSAGGVRRRPRARSPFPKGRTFCRFCAFNGLNAQNVLKTLGKKAPVTLEGWRPARRAGEEAQRKKRRAAKGGSAPEAFSCRLFFDLWRNLIWIAIF